MMQSDKSGTLLNSALEELKLKILSYSGIYIVPAQKLILEKHIQKKSKEQKITPEEYVLQLKPQTSDFDELIKLVTVNETYFFREEKHFDFLKEVIFPKYMGRTLNIWTCCCSTGEEAISLMALALSMGVNLTLYASDIDDDALNSLKKGCYSLYALRTDGKKYHHLLEPFCTKKDSQLIFNRDFLNRIKSFKFNLIQDTRLPFSETMDIIFMRNVFIYFDKQTRINITRKVSEWLKEDGLLFFSMNEVGSIDESIIPNYLAKKNYDSVYYFVRGKRENLVSEKLTSNQKKKYEAGLLNAKKQKYLKETKEVKEAKEAQGVKKESQTEKRDENIKNAAKNTVEIPVAKEKSEDFTDLYNQICGEISSRNFEKARTLARSVSGDDYRRYAFFMQGYVEYHADNREVAETFFSNSENLSRDFWPAYFYHGIVLMDMGKKEKAGLCFNRCKEILTKLGDNNPYVFTLDDFSPSYIFSLCNKFQGGE